MTEMMGDDVTDEAILTVLKMVQPVATVIKEVIANLSVWRRRCTADAAGVPSTSPEADASVLLVPEALRKQAKTVLVGLLPLP